MIYTLTDDEFEKQVYNSTTDTFFEVRPVIAIITVDHCTSCKKMVAKWKPVYEKYKEKLDIIEVDLGITSAIINDLRIRYIPTLLFFRPEKGLVKDTSEELTKEELEIEIQNLLKGE